MKCTIFFSVTCMIFAFNATLLAENRIHASTVLTEVSFGELIDKITILRIKKMRIVDETKNKNISYELSILENTLRTHIIMTEQLEVYIDELQRINEFLWEIEDAIRIKERSHQFDDEFIQLARAVYFTNDKRCAVKRSINELLDSGIIEEKSYQEYHVPVT